LNNKTRYIEIIIIDFNKKIEIFKYLISPEIKKLKLRLRKCYFIIIYSLIGFAMLYFFSLLAPNNPNFNYFFPIGEKVIILIATISILTFTYALTLEYPKKEVVANSGKYFFKSVLYFIIGMILLIGLRNNLNNPTNNFGACPRPTDNI
jgi:nitric oxide reductase large subunit